MGTLDYDAVGRLHRTTFDGIETNLSYDGVDLIAEYDATGNVTARYVHGSGVDGPLVVFDGDSSNIADATWLYADHLGSIVASADNVSVITIIDVVLFTLFDGTDIDLVALTT